MIHSKPNTMSVTDFKRDSSTLLKRMKKNHRPVLLTVNGKTEMVLQTAEDYQNMMHELDRIEAVAGIARGLAEMKSGLGEPVEKVLLDLKNKFPFLNTP